MAPQDLKSKPDEPAQSSVIQPTELKTVGATGGSVPQASWQRVTKRSRAYGRVAGLLLAILLIGGAGGYVVSVGLKQKAVTQKAVSPTIQTLSDADIRKLGQVSSNLGSSNQILTIGANSVFQGKVNVVSDLTLGGKLNANGPVALTALSISGPTNVNTLSVGQGLQVAGLVSAQNGLTVQGQTSVNGNLSVAGVSTFNSVSAGVIAARQLQISGPLNIGHLVSSGPPVTASSGGVLGGGGTASVSGNDTSGTVTASYGSGGSGGTIITVAFRAAYGANVHILVTPVSDAAAQAQYYVLRTPTGFSIIVRTPVVGTMTFDYFVVQ
jgi:cytoskeletal protein CcmA (bactofilin family)